MSDLGNLPIVWVLGGPGSGKGTQCEQIVAQYGFAHLSSGDLLRAEAEGGSERGMQLAELMARGELVPNEVVLALLRETIATQARGQGSTAPCKGFLIDGYPREKEQGVLFENAIAPVDLVLFFDAPNETLVERLLHRAETSGRQDDNLDTIQLRLRTFHAHNDLVLEQYTHKLIRINAIGTVEEIFAQVQLHLDSLIQSK